MQNNIILFKIMIYLFIFSLLNTSQNEVLCSSKEVQMTDDDLLCAHLYLIYFTCPTKSRCNIFVE